MIFHTKRCECDACGSRYESFAIPTGTYGEFLLRSADGETRYLNAIEDSVYDSLGETLKTKLPNLSAIELSDLLQKVFSITCDRSSSGHTFHFDINPRCLACGECQCSRWEVPVPPRILDLDVDSVTHDTWNRLSVEQQAEQIHCELNRLDYSGVNGTNGNT